VSSGEITIVMVSPLSSSAANGSVSSYCSTMPVFPDEQLCEEALVDLPPDVVGCGEVSHLAVAGGLQGGGHVTPRRPHSPVTWRVLPQVKTVSSVRTTRATQRGARIASMLFSTLERGRRVLPRASRSASSVSAAGDGDGCGERDQVERIQEPGRLVYMGWLGLSG
jgi:hypothetical protein